MLLTAFCYEILVNFDSIEVLDISRVLFLKEGILLKVYRLICGIYFYFSGEIEDPSLFVLAWHFSYL